jgi:N-methylhydantoinase A/oxoprolinase/acetone carboxylase beta subunit
MSEKFEVKMLVTTKGSPNGIQIKDYEQGQVYQLNKDLYDCFVDMGVVELAEEKPAKKEATKKQSKPKKKAK